MTIDNSEKPLQKGAEHAALSVFLGDWKAEGTSYGGTEQPSDDPKQNGVLWTSTHTGRWHTGEFFLIQEDKSASGRQDLRYVERNGL